jgi:hypothetical protein
VTALETADGALAAELQANVDALEAAIAENRTALSSLITTLETTVSDLNDTLVQDVSDIQQQLDDLDNSLSNDINDVQEKADDTDAFAGMLMYLTLVLFIIAIALIGVVWYVMHGKVGGSSGSGHSMEEVSETPTEVEKEFEALEKEMKKEEL